ncbi:MAG: pyruvate carboxylase subunit B [Bacteroidetes bacterium]|nr:pyruvate carboxylase subunit B [Bacteroidota bacterium]
MTKNSSLHITDTTLRDGHQSNLATRMRTEDMLPIAAEIDQMGFHSVEVWGGAIFDVATRFLDEDPWDRLRQLKALMPRTPLQMLLRSQNLVGYRHYADDVVRAFVHHAAETGIDVFRVFDALNDERNFESAFAAIQECGKHIQGTISYSLTEARLGGPVYTLEYYVRKARRLEEMGAHSLCIKDMAGILSPYDAYELVRALKEVLHIPAHLHTHYSSGMASMTYLKAIEAGVDGVDTAMAPFALRSSQPAVEPLLMTLKGTGRDPGLDLRRAAAIGEYLESVAAKYRQYLDDTRMSVIDTGVLVHQVPGGMISNFVSQLKEAGALDRLNEVFAELPRTRADLGYPPLVTPTSQMVGIQAVQNVLFGRYKMISSQVRDYAYGLYGRPPVPMDPKVQRLALKGYERGETPITVRPGDLLEPELEKAKEATRGLAKDIGDVLIYALFPTTGLTFLRRKYGLEPPPAEAAPKPAEKETPAPAPASPKGNVRTYNVYVGGERYTVEVEGTRGGRSVPRVVTSATATTPAAPQRQAPAPVVADGETPIRAPMPGMVIRYEVAEGDAVQAGQVIVVLESMKMENALVAPVAGKVRRISSQAGAKVARDEILAVIG